jgi:hypothetical protein
MKVRCAASLSLASGEACAEVVFHGTECTNRLLKVKQKQESHGHHEIPCAKPSTIFDSAMRRFESSRPSQPVRSLRAISVFWRNEPRFRYLAVRSSVSAVENWRRPAPNRQFAHSVSSREISISEFAAFGTTVRFLDQVPSLFAADGGADEEMRDADELRDLVCEGFVAAAASEFSFLVSRQKTPKCKVFRMSKTSAYPVGHTVVRNPELRRHVARSGRPKKQQNAKSSNRG